MRRLPHTSRFAKVILDAISIIIGNASMQNYDDAGERMMNTLHGRKQKPRSTMAKLTRDEHFAMRMFRFYFEIHKIVERLKDIETLISRYSLTGTRVTRAAYLQFVMEGQLHELYVLQERLLAWLVAVEKAYKSDARAIDVTLATQELRQAIRGHFRLLINLRGSHVHEYRYDNSDIERLEMMDLLSRSPDLEFASAIRTLRRKATRDTHARLKQQVRDWNKIATSAVEAVHQILYGIIFHPSGKGFLYPTPKRLPIS